MGAVREVSPKAARGFKSPAEQGARRGAQEEPDRRARAERPIRHHMHGENRRAEGAADNEVIKHPGAARGVSGRLNDPVNQVKEPRVAKGLRGGIEIPAEDPRTAKRVEGSSNPFEQLPVGRRSGPDDVLEVGATYM